jgi:hypothetical protein
MNGLLQTLCHCDANPWHENGIKFSLGRRSGNSDGVIYIALVGVSEIPAIAAPPFNGGTLDTLCQWARHSMSTTSDLRFIIPLERGISNSKRIQNFCLIYVKVVIR